MEAMQNLVCDLWHGYEWTLTIAGAVLKLLIYAHFVLVLQQLFDHKSYYLMF